MKNLLFALGVCCSMCIFSACSDDDENGGGNENQGKKLVKLIVTYTGEEEDENGVYTDTLIYDQQGRPVKIGNNMAVYSDNEVCIFELESEDPEYSDTTFYSLKNGRAEKIINRNVLYSYDKDGYMTQILIPVYHENRSYDTTTFVMENGNIKSIKERFATFTFNYEKPIPNNTTVDLYGLVTAMDEWSFEPRAFNIGGKKTAQLPTSVTCKSGYPQKTATTNFTYTIQNDVIVKITETETDEPGEAVYELFYE